MGEEKERVEKNVAPKVDSSGPEKAPESTMNHPKKVAAMTGEESRLAWSAKAKPSKAVKSAKIETERSLLEPASFNSHQLDCGRMLKTIQLN